MGWGVTASEAQNEKELKSAEKRGIRKNRTEAKGKVALDKPRRVGVTFHVGGESSPTSHHFPLAIAAVITTVITKLIFNAAFTTDQEPHQAFNRLTLFNLQNNPKKVLLFSPFERTSLPTSMLSISEVRKLGLGECSIICPKAHS